MNEENELQEEVQPEGIEEEEVGINQPYNSAEIRIQTQQMSLDTLVTRIKEGEIDLSPDFQRNEVWKSPAKSRLIESLLIRIPLPAFYVDATNEDRWVVIDGLQRLSTLRDFILGKQGTDDQKFYLKLDSLEFLKELEGQGFKELPRNYQRRIEETQVTVYKIERGTPPEVKFNIFRRINTGGMPLSSQEIRHALNQGPVTTLLKELVESEPFCKAVNNGIKEIERMADRECAIRFLAFELTKPEQYNDRGSDFDTFLSNAMSTLNKMSEEELADLKEKFLRAMKTARDLFNNKAFRKQSRESRTGFPINKSLFETWSVNLASLTDNQIKTLVERKTQLRDRFIEILDEPDFKDSVTQGTGSRARVHLRFRRVGEIIQEVLNATTAHT